jgi:class 3 adenylate cyclase
MSADVRGILPMITAPTLIMHNTGDRWIGIDNARYLATHIPNATLKEYDSPDHFVFLGHQDQKLADMEEFICGSTQVASTRLLLTVLFTDVVGSTQRLSVARDRNWHADLDEIDVDVERVTRQHGGRVCKRMGDGHLLVFERPSDAASAALALIDTLATMEVDIRAGMHFGEVEVRGDDVAGMAVHIAARVSGQAAAGQLLATSTVVELITGSPFVSEDIGERELKGVPGARHLFDITRGAR